MKKVMKARWMITKVYIILDVLMWAVIGCADAAEWIADNYDPKKEPRDQILAGNADIRNKAAQKYKKFGHSLAK